MKQVAGNNLLQFPRAPEFGATRWTIWTCCIRMALGELVNWVRCPGAIANATIKDAVTGQTIEIQTGVLFTRVNVNGRDYYFRRFTGKLDGTGSGCSCIASERMIIPSM